MSWFKHGPTPWIEVFKEGVPRFMQQVSTLNLGRFSPQAWETGKKTAKTGKRLKYLKKKQRYKSARMIEFELVISFFDSFSTTLYQQSWWSSVLPTTMQLLTDQHFSLYAISTTTGMWSDGKCSEGNAVLSRNRSSNGGSKIRVACRCRWSISV